MVHEWAELATERKHSTRKLRANCWSGALVMTKRRNPPMTNQCSLFVAFYIGLASTVSDGSSTTYCLGVRTLSYNNVSMSQCSVSFQSTVHHCFVFRHSFWRHCCLIRGSCLYMLCYKRTIQISLSVYQPGNKIFCFLTISLFYATCAAVSCCNNYDRLFLVQNEFNSVSFYYLQEKN